MLPPISPGTEPGPSSADGSDPTGCGAGTTRGVASTCRSKEVETVVYEDRTLTCRDCGEAFVFSAGEQTFFASKGLQNDPQRCPSCRAAYKRNKAMGGPREYHAAVCGMCGGQAIVPFAPRNDRPVYCSSCFDKVREAGPSVGV